MTRGLIEGAAHPESKAGHNTHPRFFDIVHLRVSADVVSMGVVVPAHEDGLRLGGNGHSLVTPGDPLAADDGPPLSSRASMMNDHSPNRAGPEWVYADSPGRHPEAYP